MNGVSTKKENDMKTDKKTNIVRIIMLLAATICTVTAITVAVKTNRLIDRETFVSLSELTARVSEEDGVLQVASNKYIEMRTDWSATDNKYAYLYVITDGSTAQRFDENMAGYQLWMSERNEFLREEEKKDLKKQYDQIMNDGTDYIDVTYNSTWGFEKTYEDQIFVENVITNEKGIMTVSFTFHDKQYNTTKESMCKKLFNKEGQYVDVIVTENDLCSSINIKEFCDKENDIEETGNEDVNCCYCKCTRRDEQ